MIAQSFKQGKNGSGRNIKILMFDFAFDLQEDSFDFLILQGFNVEGNKKIVVKNLQQESADFCDVAGLGTPQYPARLKRLAIIFLTKKALRCYD